MIFYTYGIAGKFQGLQFMSIWGFLVNLENIILKLLITVVAVLVLPSWSAVATYSAAHMISWLLVTHIVFIS